MHKIFPIILSLLCFMCCETQAKVAPPKQVSSISFEWGEAAVELSLHREPWKMPRNKPIRQFFRATVRSGGKTLKLQEEAAPILPSREADVQMIRYGDIRAEFSVGREEPQVQLGKNAQVRLESPRGNEPIIVRAHGLRISLHTELSDGKEYLCATIKPRKGEPRTVRTFLWKGTGTPAQIVAIEPGLMQPAHELYLSLQVGSLRCVLTEDGSLVECQPPAIHL